MISMDAYMQLQEMKHGGSISATADAIISKAYKQYKKMLSREVDTSIVDEIEKKAQAILKKLGISDEMKK